MPTFTVRVISRGGEPQGGCRVRLAFKGTDRGMSDAESTAGNDGCADFDNYAEGQAEVFVDGRSYGRHSFRDGYEITITK